MPDICVLLEDSLRLNGDVYDEVTREVGMVIGEEEGVARLRAYVERRVQETYADAAREIPEPNGLPSFLFRDGRDGLPLRYHLRVVREMAPDAESEPRKPVTYHGQPDDGSVAYPGPEAVNAFVANGSVARAAVPAAIRMLEAGWIPTNPEGPHRRAWCVGRDAKRAGEILDRMRAAIAKSEQAAS